MPWWLELLILLFLVVLLPIVLIDVVMRHCQYTDFQRQGWTLLYLLTLLLATVRQYYELEYS